MAFLELGCFLPLLVICSVTLIGVQNFLAMLLGFLVTLLLGAGYLFLSLEKSADYHARMLANPKPRFQSQIPQPRILPFEVPFLESPLKIVANPQNEKRVQFWYTGTLKKNRFTFQEKVTSAKQSESYKRGIVCMDGCTVTIMKTRKDGFFHTRNYLRLEHSGRPLLGSQYQLFVYFQSAKEMEEWYYALERAAVWATNSTPQLNTFRRFSTELNPGKYSQSMDPNWFTAFAHRFFFNYYDNPRFIDPFGKLINKKFSKLPLPDMIRSWTVHQIQFGASLPHLSNVQLLYVRPDGAMGLSAGMHYYGGLHFRIELIVESKFLTLVFDKKTIPAVFDFSLNSVVGDVEIHINGPPSDSLWVGFKGKPLIKMTIETAVGLDAADNTHIPKVGKILKELLRNEINDKMVLPNMESIPLPKLSKKLARKKENWAWASDAAKEIQPLIDMEGLRTPKKSGSQKHFQPIDFSQVQLQTAQFKPIEKPIAYTVETVEHI